MQKQKIIKINGIEMPFTHSELMQILFVIKKSIPKASEALANEAEEKDMDNLLNELEKI